MAENIISLAIGKKSCIFLQHLWRRVVIHHVGTEARVYLSYLTDLPVCAHLDSSDRPVRTVRHCSKNLHKQSHSAD